MKNLFNKKNSGISLVALVITIIIIIIIAMIVLVQSYNVVDKANYSQFVNDIQNIENKANSMQLQFQKEKRDDYSFSALGFKKVIVNKAPWTFRSADKDIITGYVVDLNTLELASINRGKGSIPSSNEVSFGSNTDLFIIDNGGKVFYLSGFPDDNNAIHYNSNVTKSKGITGPVISNERFSLLE